MHNMSSRSRFVREREGTYVNWSLVHQLPHPTIQHVSEDGSKGAALTLSLTSSIGFLLADGVMVDSVFLKPSTCGRKAHRSSVRAEVKGVDRLVPSLTPDSSVTLIPLVIVLLDV